MYIEVIFACLLTLTRTADIGEKFGTRKVGEYAGHNVNIYKRTFIILDGRGRALSRLETIRVGLNAPQCNANVSVFSTKTGLTKFRMQLHLFVIFSKKSSERHFANNRKL
jgi:hypothetical protein